MKTTKQTRLILIGNAKAGMCTIEELLKKSPDEFDITVFNDRDRDEQNHITLHPGEMITLLAVCDHG
jgi:nitrite reductase (NADH) large subunit